MAAVKRHMKVSNDMENGSKLFFENSLAGMDKSVLSTVKITDYPDSGHANPEPVSDYSDEGLEDFLSPQSLKMITGKSNLAEVSSLEMEVDTSETSIGNLGQLLPNLKQLKLSNSVITSIRDLGTCLNDLTMLWLPRCSLIDLDGISCFNSLKELYLAYNEIEDLSSLSMLDNLGCLDLEGNNVSDIAQVEFLAFCSRLASLTLMGNPVEQAPHPGANPQDLKFYDYRAAVSRAVPQLRILDDEPFLFDVINGKQVIRSTNTNRPKNDDNMREDLLLIQDCLKSLPVIEEDDVDDTGNPRPGSASGRRPGSGIDRDRVRPMSGRSRPQSSRNRPASSRNRPASSLQRFIQQKPEAVDRPETASKRPESVRSARISGTENQSSLDEDDSSDLTHGSKQVICGNPVRALLARRKELKGNIRLRFEGYSGEMSKADRFIPEHSYTVDESDEEIDKNEIFKELREWRRNFEKTSVDLVKSKSYPDRTQHDESDRLAISPTPPSGNPSRARPSRRKQASKESSEPPRPQTAFDFRPELSPTRLSLHNRNQRAQILSRSLDVDDVKNDTALSQPVYHHQTYDAMGTESQTRDDHLLGENEMLRERGSQRLTKQRPGTAAAASKRKSQKHFT
ncbi:leucine-rich repeat-containing protein 56-like [Rhopilema esculentum]|uniref:leucine-rich repeat-containing protein 56-like n=1 Tax=Rhopilema esculentum TaxID=499914 RepID=UPI0031E35FD7